MKLLLNGTWQNGINRQYHKNIKVPGLATDPKQINEGRLWYKRQACLPPGDWTHATLILKGARFCPAVYVNGEKVSEAPGGMTVTTHLLASPQVAPGNSIELEIELKSLKDVDSKDASKIPGADLWRSNVSSCLWDDVEIKLHGSSRITRVIPVIHFKRRVLELRWEYEEFLPSKSSKKLRVELLDKSGAVIVSGEVNMPKLKGKTKITLPSSVETWSPEAPNLYELKVHLLQDDRKLDTESMRFGFKDFRIKGLQFQLNRHPVTFRSASVVWHRWVRDPEARELAWDYSWFETNIIRRLKDLGAKGLRFHLGTPPEALLDLCDQHGLMVQIEWLFFHGMKASLESLIQQWRHWLDLCMRHPCICIIHPWNETEGDELKTAFQAIEMLAREYPPLVVSHRDVTHIHKYWWSLFENLGLYYDSYKQFPQPIVADEFGGNYLDGECNPGGYPTLKESFQRFLGSNQRGEDRLQLQTEANSQVAEYWRRIGAAGFSPFCALGSPEDGNHHFLGNLREGKPKPVWEALAAAYAPVSCSLEIWDRNFLPGERVRLPLHLFNETEKNRHLEGTIEIVPETDLSRPVVVKEFQFHLDPFKTGKLQIELTTPATEGNWRFRAVLKTSVEGVRHPVISSWRFRTMIPRITSSLQNKRIAVPGEELELRAFLRKSGMKCCKISDSKAEVLILSVVTWNQLHSRPELKVLLESFVLSGRSIVMLNIGPMDLGQGYLPNNDLGPLQGVMSIRNPGIVEMDLFHGIKVRFQEMPEPESCVHPTDPGAGLWENLEREATRLWNGLRGGLIVPARDMEPLGLNSDAFLNLWRTRGAETEKIQTGKYLAYELAGFYSFSEEEDEKIKGELRIRVKFLVEDAPALALSINPNAPIQTHDLGKMFQLSQTGKAQGLTPLVRCGKNLSRTPVVEIEFGKDKGRLILSQLLTNGRLARRFGQKGLYGIRVDPAAQQFVQNLISRSIST